MTSIWKEKWRRKDRKIRRKNGAEKGRRPDND